MGRRRKPKDEEQSVKNRLRKTAEPNAYADARTREATVRAERIEQIMKKEARELLPIDEADRIVTGMAQATSVRLQNAHKSLRAKFPNLEEKVFRFLEQLHREALALISTDLLRKAEE